ncbi:hypothetical protein CUU80_07905 [Bifidobacterium scaligerum]|uniref:Peptidase S24/S26A/S26B/S26C domain-containing protein n=1 Tax=Bifidobacterium scaligerum TaxID=2052656 RepID=A0A2M9HPL5_9BIFI|nr:hypothetical protein CUU80_07905 [Bifidobacterium scaligerum]
MDSSFSSSVENVEQVLNNEKILVSTTAGVSMWPMLYNRRDTIIVGQLAAVHPDNLLHKYDVALYRRGDSYVLHRVVGIRHTEQGILYLIRGDNTYTNEYVYPAQIIGILVGCYRKNKKININGIGYRLYTRVWVWSYPLRFIYKKLRLYLSSLL